LKDEKIEGGGGGGGAFLNRVSVAREERRDILFCCSLFFRLICARARLGAIAFV